MTIFQQIYSNNKDSDFLLNCQKTRYAKFKEIWLEEGQFLYEP